MKRVTLVLLMLFCITIFAQEGINYKAIIKDGGGNVVASTAITVQFIIYQGVGETNNVYQETHTPTTDANGIIIINIGEGTTSSVFATIDWASEDHFLNTQIDTGAGLTDMGTTAFKAVPYALSAKTAENVTGLEYRDETDDAIDNGGLAKIGRNADRYGNLGLNAVDLSFSSNTSATRGATGEKATALGGDTTASESYSTAMGDRTNASGYASTAMNLETIASGDASTAMGLGTQANAVNSLAIGRFNIGGGNAGLPVAIDPLFEVGNGDGLVRSNALTVLNNGTITAPSFDIAEITEDKALITKEYADANYVETVFSGDYNDLINQPIIELVPTTGLKTIDEGNGDGLVKVGRFADSYGNVGNKAVDLSFSDVASSTIGATGDFSFAVGLRTEASGEGSIAMGRISTALGDASIAMGFQVRASGEGSTSIGTQTEASGLESIALGKSINASGEGATAIGRNATASADYSSAIGNGVGAAGEGSTAMGFSTTAIGDFSTTMGRGTSATGKGSTAIGYKTTATALYATAMGYNTIASSDNLTVIGSFNTGGGVLNVDPLFQVGNGTSLTNRSNALTLLRNGNMDVAGDIKTEKYIYGKRAAFSAFEDSAISLDTAMETYIVPFTDITDPFSLYSNVTESFTAPRSGLYFFSTSVSFDNGNGDDDTMYMGFSVNNGTPSSSILINPRAHTTSGKEQAYSYTMVLSLGANQKVKVILTSVSATTDVRILNRTFTGYYLGE
jgi:hypothetical protein